MRVQTQNNKNQESTIFFKKAKLQSAIGKCRVSATKSLVKKKKNYIEGIVGRDVFLVWGRRYVDFLLSLCHWGACSTI